MPLGEQFDQLSQHFFTIVPVQRQGQLRVEQAKLHSDVESTARYFAGEVTLAFRQFNQGGRKLPPEAFPGIAQAIVDARSGRFGPLISVSFVLGHGGAPGMDLGWKFDPQQ